MKDKHLAQPIEDLFRNFGMKPPLKKREELQQALESEKDKFIAVERVHGQDRKRNRDLSR